MQGPASFLDIATYPPGALPTQARIVIDGVRGAILVYQDGGPVGALIGSWARSAGTDPYGNPYPQGFDVSLGVIEGPDYIFNSNGLFFYDGAPSPQNFLTGQTASFDGGLGTWTNSSANCVITEVSAPIQSGIGAMAVTATAAVGSITAANCLAANILTEGLACSPGDSIRCYVWMQAATVARTIQIGADFYSSAGAYLSSVRTAVGSDAVGAYGQFLTTVTAPANAAYCRLSVLVESPAANETHYVDTAFIANVTVNLPNLITSIAATAGVDQYGNSYQQGITVGVSTSPQVLLQPGTPHAALLFPLNAATAFTDPLVKGGAIGTPEYADLILSGPVHPSHQDQVHVDLNSSDGSSSANGALAYLTTGNVDALIAYWDVTGFNINVGPRIAQQGTPATPSAGVNLWVDTNNTLYKLIPSGRYAALSDGTVSHNSYTVTASSLQVLTDTWIVPPNDAQVDTCYRLKAWGNGTWGSTQQQANWVLSYNGANNAQAGIPASSFGASQSFEWEAEILAVVASIGSSGVITYKLTVLNSANAAGAGQSGAPTSIRTGSFTADTTAQINLSLDFFWNSTTGAPTITGRGSTFERIGN